MHDVLVKAWAMWGDYLENIFVKERQLHLGVSAITCYLHACRHQNESKSRKYLAKVRQEEPIFTKGCLGAFRFAREASSLFICAGGEALFPTCLACSHQPSRHLSQFHLKAKKTRDLTYLGPQDFLSSKAVPGVGPGTRSSVLSGTSPWTEIAADRRGGCRENFLPHTW